MNPDNQAGTGESGEKLQANPDANAVETTALEAVIAGHAFLRCLEPRHLRLLSESAMRTSFKTGETIFREGDPANRFYLVEEGRVAVESRRKDTASVEVQFVGPGDVLGWSWLFPPYYWHFDARAVEPTTAIFFYGSRLREQCEQDHDFGYEMMKRMAHVVIQRLQAARRQLAQGPRPNEDGR